MALGSPAAGPDSRLGRTTKPRRRYRPASSEDLGCPRRSGVSAGILESLRQDVRRSERPHGQVDAFVESEEGGHGGYRAGPSVPRPADDDGLAGGGDRTDRAPRGRIRKRAPEEKGRPLARLLTERLYRGESRNDLIFGTFRLDFLLQQLLEDRTQEFLVVERPLDSAAVLQDDRPPAPVDVLLIFERLPVFRFEGRIPLHEGRDAHLLEPE